MELEKNKMKMMSIIELIKHDDGAMCYEDKLVSSMQDSCGLEKWTLNS